MSIESYYVPGIIIQRKGTSTKSGLNADVASFVTHLTIEGRIRPLTGREQSYSQRDNVFSDHRLYCATADIVEGDRIVFDGKTYEVNFVSSPMNMDEFMQIDLSVVQL